MALYKCQMCGGDLTKKQDGIYECLCCGTAQTVDDAMTAGKYENAIRMFSSVQEYRDANEKAEFCKKALEKENIETIYSNASKIKEIAETEKDFRNAALLYGKIIDYKDSSSLKVQCEHSADLLHKEEIYNKACEFMANGSIHFLLQAADLFDTVSGWKDSNEKKEYCRSAAKSKQEEINKQNQLLRTLRENRAKKRKRKTLLSIITIAAVIVLIVAFRAIIHSEKNINIELLSSDSRYDDRHCYVYMDFKIQNNTGATLDYLKVTTYFTDKNGKAVGTMTSEYGSQYNGSALNLKSEQSITKETYLSELKSSSSHGTLFAELYNYGIDDLVITHEITYIKWSDGYTYKR